MLSSFSHEMLESPSWASTELCPVTKPQISTTVTSTSFLVLAQLPSNFLCVLCLNRTNLYHENI